MKDEIFVKGAKENNLKNIDVHIPRDTLTVFTDFPAAENRRSPLTLSLRKDRDGMSRVSLRMRVNF